MIKFSNTDILLENVILDNITTNSYHVIFLRLAKNIQIRNITIRNNKKDGIKNDDIYGVGRLFQ